MPRTVNEWPMARDGCGVTIRFLVRAEEAKWNVKEITRVPNMQDLKQKRQKVNPQMSRQRNTNNSRYKMRNMLPTRDIMNITQTRIDRNVTQPASSWLQMACGLTDLKTE
jgi:hypothetical protein